mmetsp:Transcript_20351/g.36864  ORF Transcript_20351/g.36864 Transcript_20351/m.36864 type:complete len:335 (-) Transcript_20351:46-1050(-)
MVGTGTTTRKLQSQSQSQRLNLKSAKNMSPDEHPKNSNRIRQEEQMMTDTGNGMKSSHRRRQVLGRVVWGLVGISGVSASRPEKAMALVKGNAPPPKVNKGGSSSPTSGTTNPVCTNVETCQEMALQEAYKAEQVELAAQANLPPIQTTVPGGTRYRTMVPSPLSENKAVVRIGDTVRLRYKVLKIGKRSYDGLSGEGTVIFSRGYGLEDDEEEGKDYYFECEVGSGDTNSRVILALTDALVGMPVGEVRRLSVTPQRGWEVPGRQCDGGPGGLGNGGDLKTDYVVVPTATMVATETCFDKTRLPFPTTYAQQRRMAQRFDQSLILQIELQTIL